MTSEILTYTLNLILLICLQQPSATGLNLKTFISKETYAFPGKCLENIITEIISCGTTVTFVYTEDKEGEVDEVIKRLNKRPCYDIITRNFDQQLDIVIVNELYVVIAKDLKEFTTELEKMTKDPLWNPKASFIINIHNVSNVDYVFKLLNTHNIFNAVLVEHERKKWQTKVYTYYPFAENSCGDNVEVVKLSECIDNVNVSKHFKNNVSDKNRDKCKACKIRIIANDNIPTVVEPGNELFQIDNESMLGIEQYILDIISKYENFELEYTYVPKDRGFGTVLDNGTSTGLLKYLATKEADIAICGLILTIKRGTFYDYIHGHSYTGFYFVVAAVRQYDWVIVYKEFPVKIWILIGVFYFLVCVISLTLKRLFPSGAQDNIGTVVKLWGYFFANANHDLSNNTNVREILACWIWFTFFVSNFYTTAFSSLMIKVPAESIHKEMPPMELYKPCMPLNSRLFFKTTYNLIFPENDENKCTNLETFLDVCASNTAYFCLLLAPAYINEKWKYIDDEGNFRLEAWEYSGLTTQGMFVPKGYVFRETLQRYANRLLEAGLIQYQQRRLTRKVNKAVDAKLKTAQRLELSTIRVAFYVLLFGQGLAVICFLGELFKYRKCSTF